MVTKSDVTWERIEEVGGLRLSLGLSWKLKYLWF
jgi:hypothetical protein